MTYREIIREKAKLFQCAGIPDPANDAALLLSYLTGRPPLELRLDSETQPDPDVLSAYEQLVKQRLKRIPLQYVLGQAPFFRRIFMVNRNVLIPRPETELLCEWALEILRDYPSPRVLDLCCGSGCIGLTLKAERPETLVCLSDVSDEALQVAAENARILNLDVSFHRGDLFSGLEQASFHLIVCNPPYIASGECGILQPEVLYEPRIALDGGTDGLAMYRRIISGAGAVLVPRGSLLMECGEGEAQEIASLLAEHHFVSVQVRKDYAGIDRMILATLF